MKQRATAIAIATLVVAAGLSVVPPAAALTADCSGDFEIADSKSTASDRPLENGMSEEGHEDILAGTPEDLIVELRTPNDELTWQVFYEDDAGDCVSYTSEKVFDTEGQSERIQLDAEADEVRDYFVVFENTETDGDQLEYRTWTE